jgi:hypothetical protein
MNIDEARERVQMLRSENKPYRLFDFRSQIPVEFLRVEVTEEVVTENAFRWDEKWEKADNGSWTKRRVLVDWKKDFIFTIGGYCGIDSASSETSREGSHSFISVANVVRLFPSGHRIYNSATYEYDAESRAEEAILKNRIKYKEYQRAVASGEKPKREVKNKYPSRDHEMLLIAENKKFGRQKADTGAYKRAIIKMLKIEKPEESMIGVHMLCFKCVPNMDSPEMRSSFLLGSGNPAPSIYGHIEPAHTPTNTQPVSRADEEPRNVTPEGISDYALAIESLQNDMSAHQALVKMSRIAVEKNHNLEGMYGFMNDYPGMDEKNRTDSIITWAQIMSVALPAYDSYDAAVAAIKKWGSM